MPSRPGAPGQAPIRQNVAPDRSRAGNRALGRTFSRAGNRALRRTFSRAGNRALRRTFSRAGNRALGRTFSRAGNRALRRTFSPAGRPGLARTPSRIPAPGRAASLSSPASLSRRGRSPGTDRYMVVGGTRAPVDDELADSGYDYDQFCNLAGPLESPRWDEPYQVQYRPIHRSKREWLFTRVIATLLVLLDIRFIYWLIFQSQYPDLSGWHMPSGLHTLGTDAHIMLLGGMAFGSIIMQLFLLVNVLTVSRACLVARDPIPVEPDTRLRVAFLTTIVPDKEPVEVAERTLRAAKAIVYDGKLDLWLLDEGNSDEVKAMCRRLGVHHFSRKDRGYLEFDKGAFAAKTKHGNHNRWLFEYAGHYDVVDVRRHRPRAAPDLRRAAARLLP